MVKNPTYEVFAYLVGEILWKAWHSPSMNEEKKEKIVSYFVEYFVWARRRQEEIIPPALKKYNQFLIYLVQHRSVLPDVLNENSDPFNMANDPK